MHISYAFEMFYPAVIKRLKMKRKKNQIAFKLEKNT